MIIRPLLCSIVPSIRPMSALKHPTPYRTQVQAGQAMGSCHENGWQLNHMATQYYEPGMC